MATNAINVALNTVNSTNTYRSKVFPGGDRLFAMASLSVNATGVLRPQVNNLPEAEYWQAVSVASGSVDEERQRNNTTGWYYQSIGNTDISSGATAIGGGSGGANLDGASTSTTGATVNSVGLTLPAGPVRRRFEYINATNSGELRIDVRYLKPGTV